MTDSREKFVNQPVKSICSKRKKAATEVTASGKPDK